VSEIKNKDLVRRIYEEMWNQGNINVAKEIFAQPEDVEKFVNEFLSAFPNLQHTVEDMIAEGDQVVARFTAKGTHTGKWKQYPASGKAIHYTGVTIASIVGGKIIRHNTWWDTMDVVEQIKGETH
jgi:steroid delta-isomerase-like uncharacterized protein